MVAPYLRTAALGKGVRYDYYVSSSATGSGDGSRSNPFTPAQISALSGAVAGKRIGIERGSYFGGAASSPTIALSDAGVSIGLYGVGSSPVFDCSAQISGAWTSLGSNKWRWTGTQEASGSGSGNVFRDGVPMVLVQNSASLTSDGQALVLAWGWNGTGISATTTFTVDIYSTVDPATDGHVYSYSRWLNAILLTGDRCTISGSPDALIVGRRSLHQGGAFMLRDSAVLNYIRAEHGSRHAIYVGVNFKINNSQFVGGRNRQEFGGFDHIVSNKSLFSNGDGGVITNCTFEGGSYLAPGLDNCVSFLAHDTPGNTLTTVVFDQCAFSSGIGICARAASTVSILSPTLNAAGRLIAEATGDMIWTITGARGTCAGLWRTNAASGAQTLNTSDCDVTVDRDLGTGSLRAAVEIQNAALNPVVNQVSDRITWVGTGGSAAIVVSTKGVTINRTNCVFSGALSDSDLLSPYDASGVVNYSGDNNIYKSSAAKWRLKNVAYNTLAAWKAAVSPADANSTAV